MSNYPVDLNTTDLIDSIKHTSIAIKPRFASIRDASSTQLHNHTSSLDALSTHEHELESSSSESDDDQIVQRNISSSPISPSRSLTSEISESLSNLHIDAPDDNSLEPQQLTRHDHNSSSDLPRRSTRPSIPPDRLDASLLYNATRPRQPHASLAFPIPPSTHAPPTDCQLDFDPDPISYRDVVTSADGDLWAAAINDEYNALVKRCT